MRIEIEKASANVFADLHLPDAEERLARALLARAIRKLIERRGWTQAHAARQAGIAASDMSSIVRGRLANFSLERLQTVILDLGMDIELRLTPARAGATRGRISVEAVFVESAKELP